SENMNFGTLTAGAAQSADLVIKYNAGYSVRMSSANEGRLKHASLSDTVPYTLQLGGLPVNLLGSNSSPVLVTSGTGVSPPNGHSFGLQATIGAIGSARAGSYSDVVTVTVATTE